VTINELLGEPDSFGIIIASQFNTILNMAVWPQDVGAVIHRRSPLCWRLKTLRAEPLIHVRGSLRLPGSPQEQFLGGARGKCGSRFPKALSLFCQAFLKGLFVLDAAALLRHGATPFGSRLLFELGGRQKYGFRPVVPVGSHCRLPEIAKI
jgi:hypothetical protein